MSCEEITHLLPRYVMKKLTRDITDIIDEHLRICNVCTKELSQIRWYFKRVSETPVIILCPETLKQELAVFFYEHTQETELGNLQDARKPDSSIQNSEVSDVRTIHAAKKTIRSSESENRHNRMFLLLLVGVLLLAYVILKIILQ